MPVTEITSFDQFKTVIAGDKPVVIDFWAPWCGPCRAISPIFARFSDVAEQAEAVGFYKVDTDALPDVAQEVGIRAMPTFILFQNGNKIHETLGANPAQLDGLIKQGVTLTKA
ncbi:putative thioredoxin [Pholiota conissans]|uniref:Thioredoxin n=1 Tax=Pholiota conissans TaxID=109636 RepID=A0A9P6CL10_9AGAR|nr:putative thioredoxin [Pholiota conissans]